MNKEIEKILNECRPFKRKGLKLKKVKKLLEKLVSKKEESLFSNESGIQSKDNKIVIDEDNYVIVMELIKGVGFQTTFAMDRSFKKINIKEATIISELTGNIFEIEIELENKNSEVIQISHKVGLENEELKNLSLISEVSREKREIKITLMEVPF